METVKFKEFEVFIEESEKFFLDGEHSAVRGLEKFSGKPIEVMVDIGAHIGISALGAVSKGAHSVFCFEPLLRNYQTLFNNIIKNSLYGRIVPINLAVWSESGALVPLRQAGTNTGQIGITFRDVYGVAGLARTISLPDVIRLAGGKVDYLKMDTEGAEFWALSSTDAVRDAMKSSVKFLDLEIHDPINAEYFDFAWFDANNPCYKNTAAARAEIIEFLGTCGFTDLLDEGKYLSGFNKFLT